MSKELALLQSWKLKIAILSAIVIPTVTVTGSFYNIKNSIAEQDAKTSTRISEVELRVEQNFADKKTMKDIQDELRGLRDDMVEIKTLLKRR